MIIHGHVIEEQKNYYLVDSEQGIIRCQIRGTLKKNSVHVCTGDFVDIEIINTDPPEGLVAKIHERKSYLQRPPLANLTQILFINSYKQPSLDLESLDRFLFTTEVYHITPVIIFNKHDLLNDEELSNLKTITSQYNKIGYRTICTSAYTQQGIEELESLCDNQISACTGLSGVGKSSLLSCLFPTRSFKTSEVSGPTGRGTHTTTTVILLPYKNGYLADTPGYSFVNLPLVDEDNTVSCFPELAGVVGQCKFNDCLHNGEPGCAVQELIESGDIAESRRKHFLKIYNELKVLRQKFRK